MHAPLSNALAESRYTDEEEDRRKKRGSGGMSSHSRNTESEQGGRVRELAERGLAIAQGALASMYYRGSGVPRDLALAAGGTARRLTKAGPRPKAG